MKCEYCGAEFAPLSVNQLYCSPSCKYKWYRQNPGGAKRHFPSVTFNCSQCGRTVVTDGARDKRTRFCSASCEKKFWRHPHWEHSTTRTNFHSVSEYAAYERRTNGE